MSIELTASEQGSPRGPSAQGRGGGAKHPSLNYKSRLFDVDCVGIIGIFRFPDPMIVDSVNSKTQLCTKLKIVENP